MATLIKPDSCVDQKVIMKFTNVSKYLLNAKMFTVYKSYSRARKFVLCASLDWVRPWCTIVEGDEQPYWPCQ